MNKRRLLLLAPTIFGLCACVDTDKVYPQGAYLSGTFVDHVYDVWEGQTKQAFQTNIKSKVTLENKKEGGYFCGNGNSYGGGTASDASTCYGYGQAKEWHPEWFRNKEGKDLVWGFGNAGETDIVNNGPGKWADNSPLYETVYSQNKRLDRFYEKFSRGYLSKLYNGQIKCNGWSYYAMMVISDQGFGTMFPYELVDAEYFGSVVLVGTDAEGGDKARPVIVNIDYTFYKYSDSGSLEGYQVTVKEAVLSCNAGAARTSLVGFKFADAGIDPKSIVGFSLTYELVKDECPNIEGTPSSDFSKDGYHDGICLYELLFPDSTWL
ncbi:MAG: hypothetical protein J6A47_00160 [Bacilli bacterium]|nr:hypothetical protein [Bacilli bacterium]MBO6286019.1 hypothetical protein [Bacilli bacterium]